MDRHPRATSAVRPLASGTSRGVLLLAALLVLAGLLPGAASAAPERGTLVVEGRGGTTTEWVLKESVALRSPMPTLGGGGNYVGVLIEALQPRGGESGRLGAVQVRAFRDRTKDAVGMLGIDGSLEPGRYRVRLFGEGSVRVRWELSGEHPGLRIVPTTHLPVTFLGRAEPLPAGQSAARVDLPGSAPAGKNVLMTMLLDGTGMHERRMCATTAEECPGGLPLCPPSPLPCDAPVPTSVGTGDPGAWAVHVPPDSRLRAAALIF